MWASQRGYLDIVKELLRAQAGVNMQDEVCQEQQCYIGDIEEGGLSAEMVFSECFPTF